MRTWFVIYPMIFFGVHGNAQTDSFRFDTSYYERYPEKFIITPFLVKNPNGLVLDKRGKSERISYISNTPVGIGLRVGYDWFAVSASYGVGAADKNFKDKGKTKALNLQTNFMARNFVADVYFQQYSSMFLRGSNLPAYTEAPYYVRSDMVNKMLGASASWVFNGQKFSIRPAFKFDTWQKKSAGSLLAGIEFLMGTAEADSAFIPLGHQETYPHGGVNKLKYLLFGPNVGYGYTYVIDKHFFISALGTLNADVGYVQEFNTHSAEMRNRRSFAPNLYFRGGVGYNKPDWQLAFSYFTKRIYLSGASGNNRYGTYNDDYRISFTKRINPGKRIPKAVGWMGNIIESLGLGFLIR